MSNCFTGDIPDSFCGDYTSEPCGCHEEMCVACCGSGLQTTNCGIKITCPVCGGTGRITKRWQPCRDYYYPQWDPCRPNYIVGDFPSDWNGPPKVIC